MILIGIICFMLGGIVGILLMGLVAAASREDQMIEDEKKDRGDF